MKFKDRYVNNTLLKCISRPQDAYNCSLASLTAVINYLYLTDLGEIQTMDMIADLLGFSNRNDSRITKGPTNQEVMQWYLDFITLKNLPGKTLIKYDRSTVYPWDLKGNWQILTEVENTIQSRDQILIYHSDNHYRPVCGYFESASTPEKAFTDGTSTEIWIILGDHYQANPAVKAIRWGEIREDFINNSKGGLAHCFLLFDRS